MTGSERGGLCVLRACELDSIYTSEPERMLNAAVCWTDLPVVRKIISVGLLQSGAVRP